MRRKAKTIASPYKSACRVPFIHCRLSDRTRMHVLRNDGSAKEAGRKAGTGYLRRWPILGRHGTSRPTFTAVTSIVGGRRSSARPNLQLQRPVTPCAAAAAATAAATWSRAPNNRTREPANPLPLTPSRPPRLPLAPTPSDGRKGPCRRPRLRSSRARARSAAARTCSNNSSRRRGCGTRPAARPSTTGRLIGPRRPSSARPALPTCSPRW